MNKPPIPYTFHDIAQKNRWIESKRANQFIDGVILVTYWICKFALRPLRTSQYIGLISADLHRGSKYVIVSNHQSIIDPFFLSSQIPFSVWQRIVTLRFFLANYIFDNKIIRPLAISLGCFPAMATADFPYGLDYARTQLDKGRSILIFPEGRRTIRGKASTGYGVQVLARVPGVMIIPMHIEWAKHKWGRSAAFGIGIPFDGSDLSPQAIMELVYAIPVK